MNLTNFNYEKDSEYIYLVMVEYKDKTLLKVGYTKTLENRMDTYELHNPDFQLLKIRKGTRELENYMHKKFEIYKYPKREEWFYYNDEIVNSFDTLEEMNFLDIDKLKNKIINLLKPKSIEELKKIYYERYQEEIEEEDLDKEDLNYIITNTFSFINKNIENFINDLDFSGIPLEIDPNTRYQIIIPNPISSVDISMDLEQILGRQRLVENPWKNSALMYVKCTDLKHITTKEEFDDLLREKTERTNKLLNSILEVSEENRFEVAAKFQRDAKVSHYRYDYVAVTRIINQKTGQVVKLKPVFNALVQITEERAFELQQSDYADRFSVFSSIESENFDSVENDVEDNIKEFNGIKRVNDRIRYMMDYSEKADERDFKEFLELIPGKYKDYYTIVGPEIIKAYGCEESKIKKAWREKVSNSEVQDDIVSEIYSTFVLGQRYTKSDIKETLKGLYEKMGYKKTAKATDLELYYYMKPILTPDKKAGFELIGKR